MHVPPAHQEICRIDHSSPRFSAIQQGPVETKAHDYRRTIAVA